MDDIYLKELSESDIDKIFRMSKEDHLIRYLPDQEYKDIKEAKEVVESLMGMYEREINPLQRPYVLGVYKADTREIIGHVGLSNYKVRIEIGFAIEKKHLGKGYAKKAVMHMMKKISNETDIKVIYGIVDKNNVASIKVLENNSFTIVNEVANKLVYENSQCEKLIHTSRVEGVLYAGDG